MLLANTSAKLTAPCHDWVIEGETGLALQPTRVGWGLFTTRPFATGEHVLTFKGPILTQAETLALGNWSMYPIQIDQDRYIHCGPPGAFVNHRCEASCGVRDSVRLVALRDLIAGDEITMDYSCCMSGDSDSGMTCLCCGTNCRGSIQNFEELPESLQALRISQCVVSEFIVVQHQSSRENLASVSSPTFSLGARLPMFPKFTPMALGLLPVLRDFASAYPPFNDFSVLTLHCFDDGQPKLSQLNGNLVLRLVDPATDLPYLTLLGKNKIEETVEALKVLSVPAPDGIPLLISAVPEVVISGLSSNDWFEQTEYSEYVYSIEKWLTAPSANLAAKQRRADRFLLSHPQTNVLQLNLEDSATCHRIENFASACWLQKGPLTCGPLAELRALLRCLAAARQLGCVGYGIESFGALMGFIILEPVHGGYVHAHFGSTLLRRQGLSEYFMFEITKEVARLGYTHLNDHEDLGLEGLRQSKRAWEPVRMLKKYHPAT